MFPILGTSEYHISSLHNPLHQLPVTPNQPPPHTPELLRRVPLRTDPFKPCLQCFHRERDLYRDSVRLPNSRRSLAWFLVNNDLGSLDSYVSYGVVPISNAQKGVPEPLDQPHCSAFTWLQMFMRFHVLQHCFPRVLE